MTKSAEIKDLIKSLSGNPESPIISAVVKSVDSNVCSVELSGGLIIDGVRIKPTTEDSAFLVMRPKKGSIVKMIAESNDIERLIIISIDQVESIELKTDDLNFLFDTKDGKFSISNQKTSFLDLLLELIGEVKALKVSTPSGPSVNVLPDNILRLNALESTFKKLLK